MGQDVEGANKKGGVMDSKETINRFLTEKVLGECFEHDAGISGYLAACANCGIQYSVHPRRSDAFNDNGDSYMFVQSVLRKVEGEFHGLLLVSKLIENRLYETSECDDQEWRLLTAKPSEIAVAIYEVLAENPD